MIVGPRLPTPARHSNRHGPNAQGHHQVALRSGRGLSTRWASSCSAVPSSRIAAVTPGAGRICCLQIAPRVAVSFRNVMLSGIGTNLISRIIQFSAPPSRSPSRSTRRFEKSACSSAVCATPHRLQQKRPEGGMSARPRRQGLHSAQLLQFVLGLHGVLRPRTHHRGHLSHGRG